MIIGSKFPLRSLQLDNFSMSLDSDKLELVERAKYLVFYIKNDLSWDEHVLKTCQNMNYFIHVLRRLRRIFPRGLLLKVYKSYIQSKLEYGLTIWGCTTDTNLGKIQRIQSLAVRIITGNFDYIHFRGVDIVRSLHLQTVKERRDYFLLTCALRRSIVLQFFWHVDTCPILPFLLFFNSTFYSCIIIVIFYLMYLIH